jgi:hypothetical protein
MFIKYLRLFLASVALLWAISAGAVAVPGLYSAELNVAQAGVQPLPEQVEAGLERVLVKLAGVNDVASLPTYGEIMGQAQALLREYRYLGGAGGSSRLSLGYDQSQLDALLQAANIRGPGQQRPVLLLWLVHKPAGAGEDYIPADHAALQALLAQAQRRGLPLQQPLLDLQDLQQLAPQALWQLAQDPVLQASRRYQPEAVLAGRVWVEGGLWFSEFEFMGMQQRWQRFTPAGELAEQMTEVIDQVADQMLGRPRAAPVDYRPAGLVLQVEGVATQVDYLALVERLRQAEGVTAVFPERLSRGHLQLRVQLQTSVEQLQETLRLDHRFVPLGDSAAGQAVETGLLQYRWQN